jgi:hypothetical protein
MAWRFRRSLKLGPLRLNLSKSGIGVSAGVRGFRVGTDAKGRTYAAASIPGTGLYNRAYYGASKPIAQNTVPLTSVPPQPRTGNGLKLLVAFMLGGVVFSIIGAMMSGPPASPLAPPPAAVIAPVAPPSVAPAKWHVQSSKRASDPGLPHPSVRKSSPTSKMLTHPASDAVPPPS